MQVIQKIEGKYKVVKTIGYATTWQEVDKLVLIAKQEISNIQAMSQLFVSETDLAIDKAFEVLTNSSVQTIGPELIFGKIYDYIVFP